MKWMDIWSHPHTPTHTHTHTHTHTPNNWHFSCTQPWGSIDLYEYICFLCSLGLNCAHNIGFRELCRPASVHRSVRPNKTTVTHTHPAYGIWNLCARWVEGREDNRTRDGSGDKDKKIYPFTTSIYHPVSHGNPLRLQTEKPAHSAEQHTYTYSTAGAPWVLLVRWSKQQAE